MGFILFEALVQADRLYSADPICSASKLSPFTNFVTILEGGAHLTTFLLNASALFSKRKLKNMIGMKSLQKFYLNIKNDFIIRFLVQKLGNFQNVFRF